MRSIEGLAAAKVVLVTDRTQLQRQLSRTLMTGEEIQEAASVKKAKRLLSEHGPGIVAVMILKQQDVAARKSDGAERDGALARRAETPMSRSSS